VQAAGRPCNLLISGKQLQHCSVLLVTIHVTLHAVYLQECKALGVFSQLQALEYLGGKLTQRGNRAFERRRKSKVGS
jgi:hypothetical protein